MNTSHTILSIRHAVLGILLYTVFVMSPVHAETTNCTAINSLPYVITVQGVYCFTRHLSTNITTGNAIEIQANNVTIDMNGYKLGGLAAGAGTNAVGIYAIQRKNITIRNGIIRGFFFGINLADPPPYITSQGHVVRDILADQNLFVGIQALGHGMTIRSNQVVDTGTLKITGHTNGISVWGRGNHVLDNQVSTTTTTSTGNAFGITLGDADNSMVKDNRVSEVVATGTGASYGIYMTSSNDVLVRNNMISAADNGVYYSSSSGKYMGTLTSNVTTPFTGGTAVGFNN